MKKRFFLFLGFAFYCLVSSAQLLVTTPSFPTDTSTIAITVDAAKGNKGLMNYQNTNDVYVHVGVITSTSANPSDWKYVKFTNFNAPDAGVKATSLGNNKYRFVITNPRTFFAVPASEKITHIAILFRNGNGSVVQRNADGSDMYVPLYTDQLNGKFISPAFEPKFVPTPEIINKQSGETIDLNYITSENSNISFYYNGNLVSSVNGSNILSETLTLSAAGNQEIVAKATNGSENLADTIRFFLAPATTIAALPGGVRDGINYEEGDTSAILVLYAPGKTRVSLIGDFNNWTESVNYQLNKTPDGNRFWTRVKGLQPGTEYGYQYVVNSSLRIADPFAEKVLDPNNDATIPASTYPNLKAYPTGKTTGIVGLLQTAMPVYNWQLNDFNRPDKRNLLVYELLVRDFVAAHNWQTLKDTLPYLKALGINAIELMPFNEFEGNLSWGYNPSFYFAPDKFYGTATALKQFIDECHRMGIAVIMDIALNHSFGQSPMVQLYFDAANNRPDPSNPWYNPVAKHPFNVGYDFNHETAATRAFTSRVIEHWLKEYKIDGFRFDLSKGFTQQNSCDASGNNCNVDNWSSYDPTRIAIWKKYYDSVQLKSPGAYVILEHFADNAEEKELSNYGMMFWGNSNYNFNEATMGYLPNSNFEYGLFTVRNWTNPFLVTYMESHDEERLAFKNKTYGNSAGSYSTKELSTSMRRNEMAAAFGLLMPGPKMIWQFGELGYDFSINHCGDGTINANCRTDAKPIRWDYLQVTQRKRLHDVYAALLKLRTNSMYAPAFMSNRVTHSLAGAIKWMKVTADTSNLVVVGNFDVTQGTASISFPHDGTWTDYLSGQSINVTGAQNMTLQPGEYHVYVDRNLVNVITGIREISTQFEDLKLQVYPNPVVGQAQVSYRVPATGEVQIRVVSQTGQPASKTFRAIRTKGEYQLNLTSLGFYSETFPGGLYFIEMQFAGRKKIRQFIVK